ncbi:hypothetical protein AGMMS49992_03720 [Clostridia bacterium]|nr:hypothetical protein AGMMS49992_03720 [Clostridia bacterium]
MNKWHWPRLSIFTTVFLLFALVITPFYALGLLMNDRGRAIARSEIYASMTRQMNFYMNNLELEVSAIINTEVALINNGDVHALASLNEIPDNYELYRQMERVRVELATLRDAQRYIESAYVLFPRSGLKLTSTSRQTMTDADRAHAADPAFYTGYPLIQDNSGIYINFTSQFYMKTPDPDKVSYIIVVKINSGLIAKEMDDYFAASYGRPCLVGFENGLTVLNGIPEDAVANIPMGLTAGATFGVADTPRLAATQPISHVAWRRSDMLKTTFILFCEQQHFLSSLNAYRSWIILFTCAMVLILVVYTIWMNRILAVPMNRLTSAIKRGIEGDLNNDIPYQANEEFTYIYRQYNDMLRLQRDTLRQSYEQSLRLAEALPLFRDRLIFGLLDGEIPSDQELAEVEVPLDVTQPVLLLVMRPDDPDALNGMEIFQLRREAGAFLAQKYRVFSVVKHEDIVFFIQLQGFERSQSLPTLVRSNLDALQRICEQTARTSVSIAIAEEAVPFLTIAATWCALRQSLRSLAGLSRSMLLIADTVSTSLSAARPEERQIQRLLENCKACVDSGQHDRYFQHYNELKQAALINPNLERADKAEIAMQLCLAFLASSRGWAEPRDEAFADILPGLGEGWPADDTLLTALADVYFGRQSQVLFHNTNEMLGHLGVYINEHLDGDLSLNRLAETIHLSPSYLSRLFRQMTGESLTEYIGRRKYKKACTLLSQSSMKIADVARSLGFDTPSYFTRFFKKYANLSPQEYRDAHMTTKDKQGNKG